jgi:hypothetical protein
MHDSYLKIRHNVVRLQSGLHAIYEMVERGA